MPKLKFEQLLSSHDRLRESAKRLFSERGYEAASTAEICRLAGTSQSQLIKHYRDKQGLLEAVFEYAWEQINPALRLATESVAEPRERLHILTEMVLNFLEKDPELRTIFLLEGRRIRGDGHMVVLVPGYLEFVKILDGILNELAKRGQLTGAVKPEALRSGLIGAVEGMLRDLHLARTSRFPAGYSAADIRVVFNKFLSSCLAS